VIAGYIDRPGLGLELAKLEKDGKLFTSSGLYVLFCHITDLKLLDNINANCIDVLGKLHPLKYVPVHKAAYDHTYMIETFGHNQPNPILHYDNNPVPMTEDGKIDMPYLKALVALQPQKYGISTWLHKTGVYKYAAEHNLSEGVSEAIRTGDIVKTMGQESEQKYHDMWFNTFREHSLSFSHWFNIYQIEKSQQIEIAKMIHAYHKEQEDSDDWDDIPMAAQQPNPPSPTHHFAKVPSFGVKQLDFVDHLPLTSKEQKRLIKECQKYTTELTEQTRIVTQSVRDYPLTQKPGIASMVNDWITNEIRGKLLDPLESKDFIPFSTFILDTSLNDLFFSDTSAEWNIFEAQFDDAKPPSQAEITFFATRKLMNIIIEPEDFLPNGRLAHVYIPNYLYLPVTLTDALDIGDKNPNDTLSHDECFYIWSKARKARAKATQTRMFCKTPLLPFTPISPYFLWLCTENKTYTTDYDQHVAAVTFAISHTEMHTMLFYDLFIRPIEWMFSLNTTHGQMLREAISSFPKATKFVNLMINVVASFYASSDLDHEQLFEEMTKTRHLALTDLRPNPDSENAPIFRANHSPWPQSAFPASPATLTSEQLQMFINKAQDILLLRHSTDTLAIDHPDSLPIYDMFPEHGGIFMHESLKQRLHELSADRIMLSNEKTKPSGNLNRPTFFISDESSDDETELIFEIPDQGAILNIPLGILSPLLSETTLADFQKRRKQVNWIQPHLNPQRLLATTIANIKHQDPLSLTWFTTHEEPLPIWALYSHTAYTFAKTFNPLMCNAPRFKVTETSRSFPADDVESNRQIQIKTVDNCPADNIVKISESYRGYRSLTSVENCIFIRKQSIDKLLQVCVQTLNTLLLPPKEDLNLPFGCYASRMLKDHSSGMSYLVDITREPMQEHGFRFVRIFQQTTFNQKDVGNVDIPWNHFDVFTRELNGFLKTPGRLATFFPKASKLQRTKL